MKYLFIIILILPHLASATIYSTKSQNGTYYPFGLPTKNPPTKASIVLIDEKIGISASQVCGMTSFKDAVVSLPLSLFKGEYWDGVYQNGKSQAVSAFTSIIGAAPMYFAATVSPSTFTALNVAMAQASLFTSIEADTCKMMDSAAAKFAGQDMAACVQLGTVSFELPNSVAIEKCLRDRNAFSGKKEQSNFTANILGESAGKFIKFIDHVFSTDITIMVDGKTQTISTRSGDGAYSKDAEKRKVAESLIPGIEVKNGIVFKKTTPIKGAVDKYLSEVAAMDKAEISLLLQEMKKAEQEGYGNPELKKIIKTRTTQVKQWIRSGRPHAIFAAMGVTTAPMQIIPDEELIALLPLMDKTGRPTPKLNDILTGLTNAVAYYKAKDVFNDIYIDAKTKCGQDDSQTTIGDAQGADKMVRYKKHQCDSLIRNAQLAIEVLDYNMKADIFLRDMRKEVFSYAQILAKRTQEYEIATEKKD